ncbi:DivIVA domain-containing protein [Phytoactinopolyspora mesophila]|uniref:DivIVA domain-containing protein n=1 Tax=Phytoactinopolyspora mesophila TaxID=2650750 RepID=A0A7K3M8Z5_9ACTN|nr:DivIVA domain-containing protein [Phytoactinopolyspora mesophila]NDL59749.1 DivIVA domain-containing protein [Phytoactinopolyspora mesophila]
MYVLFAVLIAAVVFMVVALTLGRGQLLEDEPPVVVGPELGEQPLTADDLAGLRFAVVARGYRMNQVDDVLARVRAELAERDARIAELEDTVRRWGAPEMVRRPRPVWDEDG